MTDRVVFEGHRCIRVTHPKGDSLFVTVEMGPRILGYLDERGRNRLAVLPGSGLEGPGGRFRFIGGHRLWVAPERPAISYLPDDAECAVEVGVDDVLITAPDNGSGLERSLVVSPSDAGFTVEHIISNCDEKEAPTLAPWAITQLPLGGTAVVPFRPPSPTPDPQASHALVLWSYTDPDDERLTIGREHALVRATAEMAPCKIGVVPGSGRLAYVRDGDMFEKKATPPAGAVPDLGAAAQVYTGAGFIELETLGPSVILGPGERTSHTEFWSARAVSGLEEAVDILGASS